MKRWYLLLSLVLALLCPGATAGQKVVDLDGNPVAKGTKCAAQQKMADGTTRVYRKTPEDVAKLVAALKAAGVKDESLFDPKVWLADNCSSQAASKCAQGSCGTGRCKLITSGGFNFCKCI